MFLWHEIKLFGSIEKSNLSGMQKSNTNAGNI